MFTRAIRTWEPDVYADRDTRGMKSPAVLVPGCSRSKPELYAKLISR